MTRLGRDRIFRIHTGLTLLLAEFLTRDARESDKVELSRKEIDYFVGMIMSKGIDLVHEERVKTMKAITAEKEEKEENNG